MIKGIIFDLDGVLVNTDNLHYLAWKKIADKENILFNPEINNKLRGVSRMESLDIILENSNKKYKDDEKIALATIKNNYYVALLDDLTKEDLLDGSLELLNYLKENNYKIAIGSSSKNAKKILEKLNITNYFDAISDGTNIINSKPHPEVFLKAKDMLNLQSNECIVIEDAKSGIDAAYNAKMLSIGLNDAYNYDKANYSINHLSDIINILDQLKDN